MRVYPIRVSIPPRECFVFMTNNYIKNIELIIITYNTALLLLRVLSPIRCDFGP